METGKSVAVVGMEDRRRERSTPSSPSAILLASTGEPFDQKVIDQAVALAGRSRPTVHVLSIATVWGTRFGVQHRSLYPSQREWRTQAEQVAEAVKRLERKGFTAKGRVVATRQPAKAIASEAVATGADLVVVGRRALTLWRRLLLQDETGRITRRTRVPVHIVDLSM